MVAQAFVRQFAAGQKIDLDVADQEVVLHYALARLNEIGLVGYPPGAETPGPLLFKGGTALRKSSPTSRKPARSAACRGYSASIPTR